MRSFPLERFLNARSAYGASFGPDGTLAFLADVTGTPQVWTLSEPCGWPDQRTFSDDPVSFVDWSPVRDELAFGMDDGGDERTQFFRLDPDGTVRNLTRTPTAKHRWGGWSHDGERFAFTANRGDESSFGVYVQGRDEVGDDARLVRESDGQLSIGGWSPDDRRLVVTRSHSNVDEDLYVLDLDSGDLQHVTPDDGNARYGRVSWGPDGDALYTISDVDADTRSLVRIDVETLAVETVVDGGPWNVEGLVLDGDTRRLAYSRNVHGYSEVTVGELASPTEFETLSTPNLLDGVVGGVEFDRGADRLAMTVTGSTENANVHVVDVATGTCERWTRASTGGVPRETFRERELVEYETFDGRTVPAFLTLPDEEDRPAEGAPVVVHVHGGPEAQRRPAFSPVAQYFLSRGYAYLEPNVRGSTGYGLTYARLDDGRNRMDAVRDVVAGVEWLDDHPAVDADRAAVYGSSYGGFVALACLTEYPDQWSAGVDVAGIANFVTFLRNTGSWRREMREAEYGSLPDDREFLESISPVNNADSIRAPLFVVHGANDTRVPVSEAKQIAKRADEHVPVSMLLFEDEGHGIAKRSNRIEMYTRIAAFLDEHV